MIRNKLFALLVSVFLLSLSIPVFAQDEGYAPVPPSAFDPNMDLSKGYYVAEISDGLYWITEGAYQVIFLTTGEGVIIVDAPPSIGQNLLNAISDVTDEPIKYVIYSHSHADHIGAAGLYPEDATYIAQEQTAEQLAQAMADQDRIPFGTFVGGAPVPLPTVTFTDSYTLEVGDQVLQFDYRGPNHEPGNIFVYAPKQKVLMLVDIVFPGWIPFKDLALAEDIPGFLAAHDEILSYDFDVFVGGHLTRLGTREDVETQKQYFADIAANAATALQTVDFQAIANEVGYGNAWVLFDTYLNALAQTCADATIPNWVDRLGGADIWTYNHCAVMVESLRIE